jgi:hypothetical protein
MLSFSFSKGGVLVSRSVSTAKSRLAMGALLFAPLFGLACDACFAPPGATNADMDRLAAAFALSVIECSPRSAFASEVEPDDPRDVEQIEENFRSYFRLLLEDENVGVDPAPLASCIAFLESDERCETGFAEGEGDCDRIFTGLLEGGQRCALREECASEVCVFGGSSACGTCADSAEGQQGEFCGLRVCAEGLFCQYGHPNGAICEVLRQEGQLCYEEIDRVDVFFRCDDGLGCTEDNECRPLVGEGGSCDDGLRCELDLECRGEEGARTCEQELVGREEGDACDPEGVGCGLTLSTGLACVGEPGGATCVRARVSAEGEPCDGGGDEEDRTSERWCRNGLTTHHCRFLVAGEPGVCEPRPTTGDDCRGTRCDTATSGCVVEDGGRNAFCRAWPDPGEPCLTVDGAPTCGPELFCSSGPGGAQCATSPLPTVLAQCG